MNKASAPILIIACGLTGTGKSTILNEVAEKTGFAILTSDRVRKALVGIKPEEHRYEAFDSGIYSKELSEKTYLHMIEEGKRLLLEGKSVILDACFPKKWQRDKAREAAAHASAQFLCIEFTAPESEVKQRLDQRFETKDGISDGRWEIYVAQKESFEESDDIISEEHLTVDTAAEKEECVKLILARLGR
ncbi:MAG: AAA family ATPase [Thermoplasmata archaeon]|nr:MAG: AAA family ATPase [Thermoplasmata archaeon]